MHALCTTHLDAIKRIFRYLQGIMEHGLWFCSSRSPSLVVAYSNADWVGCRDSYRSTTRYAIFLGPNLIAWCSKKQPTISESSTEAEYRALGYTVVETIWVQKLLFDLCITISSPVRLYYDNLSAIYMCTNPVQHDRRKYIAMDYHFVHERVTDGDLVIRYILNSIQVTDVFIKGLSTQQFLLHRNNLSLHSPDQIEGV